MQKKSRQDQPVKILLIEDNFDHASLIKMFLDRSKIQDFDLSISESLKDAYSKLEEIDFDVILLDLTLPESNGLDTFNQLHPRSNGIPIVVLSGIDDEMTAIEAVRSGAQDYLVKGHADQQAILRSIRYAMERKKAEATIQENEDRFRFLIENSIDLIALLDSEFKYIYASPSHLNTLEHDPDEILGKNILNYIHPDEKDTASSAFLKCLKEEGNSSSLELRIRHKNDNWHYFQIFINSFLNIKHGMQLTINAHDITDRIKSARDMTATYDATLEGWSKALELRDKETKGHSKRVTDMTTSLAAALGIKDDGLVHIRRGTLLHDIGKMAIPDDILQKNGPLNDEEWVIMKRHPLLAYEMLYDIAYLRPSLDIPYSHHEKWDGTGYPRGLKETDIPLAARIFSVVDVWDALRSDRPYKKAWSEDKTKQYLLDNAGSHFDPDIVATFVELFLDD